MMDSSLLPGSAAAPKARILIVEDDYILAANLQETLETMGYDAIGIADSVELALKQAIQFRPHLVLMDIRLQGGMDGIQAAMFLWKTLCIPVIYVTGHSDRSTLERAAETVPFGYLLKPVKTPELEVAISAALHCCENK